jgi:precorrin-2 dehydrogenase/sirohydrochlorin ferrochelatase
MKNKSPIFLPVCLNISKKRCLVIGGGKVAQEKIKRLLRFGANVILISPEITGSLKSLVSKGLILFKKQPYKKGFIRKSDIVFTATSSSKINRRVSMDAISAGALVNVADSKDFSSFIMPAIYKKENITVAVSTAGKSPALAKALRDKIREDWPKISKL